MMAERVLREQCKHGRYEAHHFVPLDPPCLGGREVTIDYEAAAREGHAAYERLAPAFDYRTRGVTQKHWDDLPENNKALMIAAYTVGVDAALGEV